MPRPRTRASGPGPFSLARLSRTRAARGTAPLHASFAAPAASLARSGRWAMCLLGPDRCVARGAAVESGRVRRRHCTLPTLRARSPRCCSPHTLGAGSAWPSERAQLRAISVEEQRDGSRAQRGRMRPRQRGDPAASSAFFPVPCRPWPPAPRQAPPRRRRARRAEERAPGADATRQRTWSATAPSANTRAGSMRLEDELAVAIPRIRGPLQKRATKGQMVSG
jgi:hypothetical protein